MSSRNLCVTHGPSCTAHTIGCALATITDAVEQIADMASDADRLASTGAPLTPGVIEGPVIPDAESRKRR